MPHLAGPATLYMMRFNIAQPISHQSKTLLDFAPAKVWRADEAQEHDAKEHAKSCDQYQAVAKYQRRKRRPKLGRSAAILELIAGGLAATHEGTSDPATDATTETQIEIATDKYPGTA